MGVIIGVAVGIFFIFFVIVILLVVILSYKINHKGYDRILGQDKLSKGKKDYVTLKTINLKRRLKFLHI